jgi:drug/metabolite transporter (DMT)-like permease
MSKNKIEGHAAILFANIFFGLNIPFTKTLLTYWVTPIGYMVFRTTFALLFFWILQCFVPKEKVVLKDLLIIALGGFLGFILSQFTTATSLKYTSPVYFSLIVALSPVVVMLLAALFLKEPITKQKILGVIVGVAGALLLILNAEGSGSGKNNLFGILLATMSIITYAIYLIIIRSVAQKYSAITQMKWMFLFTAIIILPFGIKDISKQVILSSACNWSGILDLGFVLIFPTALGYFLVPFGMKYIRATTVSIYMNLQPIVASVAAIFIGQDSFTWDKPIAAVLVIAGAYIVTTSKAKGEIIKK